MIFLAGSFLELERRARTGRSSWQGGYTRQQIGAEWRPYEGSSVGEPKQLISEELEKV
jgi:hypothetical protein